MQNQPVGVVLRLPFKYFLKTYKKRGCYGRMERVGCGGHISYYISVFIDLKKSLPETWKLSETFSRMFCKGLNIRNEVKKQWITCEKIGYICLSLTGGRPLHLVWCWRLSFIFTLAKSLMTEEKEDVWIDMFTGTLVLGILVFIC